MTEEIKRPEEIKRLSAKHTAEMAIKAVAITFVFTYIIFSIIHM